MEDNVTPDAEAAALQAAQAGYERRAGITPAPTPEPVKTEQPLADAAPSPAPAADAPAADDDEPDLEAEPVKEPPAQDAVAQQLEDLKAQVRELSANGVDKATVHRLFGEIGGITRLVKQLQSKDAPTESQLAGAMKKAEAMAQEYPDIAGPLVEALKAMQAQLPASPEPEPQPETPPPTPAPTAAPPASPYTEVQKEAIRALDEVHPDRHEINKSADFKSWLASQGKDYESKFKASWNAAYISAAYTKFKDWKAAKERRQQKLAAAAATPGVAAPASNVLPDEAGFSTGYARAKAKRHF